MSYVKISLEEYDELKESYKALRKKKTLKVSLSGFFNKYEYYTDSEIVEQLTKELNDLSEKNNDLIRKYEELKYQPKKKSFLEWIRKIVNK